MATDFFSLPPTQQVQISTNLWLTEYGVTKPLTEAGQKAKLDKAIAESKQDLNNLKSSLNQIVTLSSQSRGLSENQVRTELYNLNSNDPRLNANPAYALVTNELKQDLNKYLAPNYSVNSFTFGQLLTLAEATTSSLQNIAANPQSLPPAGQSVTFTPTPVTIPTAVVTKTSPANTTAPSTNTSSSVISNILTAAAVIGGGALVVNALNNRVQNSTVPIVPAPEVNTNPEIPVDQETINPNNDPNTNIGAEAQDVTGFEPLTEPPITNDGDEFSGIDEQIQRQKDLEDGSLEFAGIDDQIAANENTLQEPPQLSEEEINQQIQQAGQEPDVQESVFDTTGNGGAPQGISTALNNTRATATKDDSANFQQKPDWRARLSLAPNANYLYKVPKGQAGILGPLQGTDGVIFPYTPAISVTYSAGYDASELVHSNYKVYQYKGSSVDTVSITADFTAQDTPEANYLLAVIHFFRSVTKMFYGQDQNPNNGVPPPLCYLSGFGAYTFDAHPLVVTNFTYSTPTDVDYIRAGSQTNQPGVNVAQQNTIVNSFVPSVIRTAMNGLAPKIPNFSTQNTLINSDATYVPTKLQLQITCIPIVTRNDISNKFSLKEYATGALLRGSKRSGGGIW